MRTSFNLSERLVVQLCVLYQDEWWSRGRTHDETRRVVDHSDVNVVLLDDDDNVAGFARVLTDFTFKAMIFDVIVAPAWRGQGLGDRLLRELRAHPALRQVRHFELYCLPELADFYRRFGFSSDVGDVILMRAAAS